MDVTVPKSLPRRMRDFVLWRGGPALSRLGERMGFDWLIYNPLLYHSFNELALRNAPGVIGAISSQFPQAQRYLDVGAGGGAFAARAAKIGKTVKACEYSPHGRKLASKQGVDIHAFDLTQDVPTDIPECFDLAYCFEIAEHLTPEIGDRLVTFLVEKAPIIVFTAAHPGQQGSGHINEQPKSYWIERFAAKGATHLPEPSEALSKAFAAARVSIWFEENVLVFQTGG
jgi:2-polyprenyl-3-methyl-5-hydroxy-6-metoxy-1,4-benzoquinol methylase